MLLDYLLNLADLVLVYAIASNEYAFGDRDDSNPAWQDLGNTDNYALHLARVNELAVDALLKQLDHLNQV